MSCNVLHHCNNAQLRIFVLFLATRVRLFCFAHDTHHSCLDTCFLYVDCTQLCNSVQHKSHFFQRGGGGGGGGGGMKHSSKFCQPIVLSFWSGSPYEAFSNSLTKQNARLMRCRKDLHLIRIKKVALELGSRTASLFQRATGLHNGVGSLISGN